MPRGTKRSLKRSAKPKKYCCGQIVTSKGLTVWKGVGVTLLLENEDCAHRAQLAAIVAQNTCLLEGGTEQECQAVYDQTYAQVYEECQGG